MSAAVLSKQQFQTAILAEGMPEHGCKIQILEATTAVAKQQKESERSSAWRLVRGKALALFCKAPTGSLSSG